MFVLLLYGLHNADLTYVHFKYEEHMLQKPMLEKYKTKQDPEERFLIYSTFLILCSLNFLLAPLLAGLYIYY